jgi:hypothetical protein
MRSSKVPLLLLTAVLAAAAPGNAHPRSCPLGQRPTPTGCISTAPSLHTTAPPVGDKTAPAAPASPQRPSAPELDVRLQASLSHRTRALLVEEIARLESLLKSTPAKSPDRAARVLRVADDYAELAKLAEREHTFREIEVDAARRELDRDDRQRARKKSTPETTDAPARPTGPPHRPIRM